MKYNKRQALESLVGCLRGEVPLDIDWLGTIALANESLTSTNLAARLLAPHATDNVPEDVRMFLRDVLARNEIRNRRILSQMSESIRVLNGAGITPVLLKGSAVLAAEPSADNARRMVSDIDLLVRDEELAPAISSLKSIGYAVFEQDGSGEKPVTLARQSDVGMLDLHARARGPAALRADAGLYNSCSRIYVGSATALLPSPTYLLLHFVLHDQFYSRDFWRGSIDLRHICDLAHIVARHDVDWAFLQQLFSGRTAAGALSTQLVQLNRLLGAQVPASFLKNAMARFQYWRALMQLQFPLLRGPFTCLTVVASWNHRNRDALVYGVGIRRRFLGRIRGAWRFFTVSPVGKL